MRARCTSTTVVTPSWPPAFAPFPPSTSTPAGAKLTNAAGPTSRPLSRRLYSTRHPRGLACQILLFNVCFALNLMESGCTAFGAGCTAFSSGCTAFSSGCTAFAPGAPHLPQVAPHVPQVGPQLLVTALDGYTLEISCPKCRPQCSCRDQIDVSATGREVYLNDGGLWPDYSTCPARGRVSCQ